MTTTQFALMIHLALLVSCVTPIIYLYTWWPSSLETTPKYADVIENLHCRDVGQIFLFPLSEAPVSVWLVPYSSQDIDLVMGKLNAYAGWRNRSRVRLCGNRVLCIQDQGGG